MRSVILVGVLLLMMVLIGPACTLVEVNLGPKMAPLEERTIAGSGEAKVLMVDISGVMLPGNTRPDWPVWSAGESMASRLAEELARARLDPLVQAVLVRINSPGGAVSTADLLYYQIKRFREETGIKVVAALMDTGASGGYYAALAADRIVALPTTITGSIGVISLTLNISGLMHRYGVETQTVKSAPLKDMWSPFRPATEEERRIMQGLIDALYARFKAKVRENRPGMTEDQLEEAGRAQVFTAPQALELGLIDQTAYPEEAFDFTKEINGLTEARLVVYHRPGAYRPNIYSLGPNPPVSMNVSDFLSLGGAPQLMYLWLPGIE